MICAKRSGFSGIGCNIVQPETGGNRGYTEEVYREQLRRYRDFGFDCVEISHCLDLSEEAARRLRNEAANLGITIWSLHSEHLNDLAELDAYYQVQDHCARIAGALGCRVMVCHLPNVENRGRDSERDVRILGRVGGQTRRHGVWLGIEPCWDDDVSYVIRMVDGLGRSDVGITFDTGHVYCYINRDVASEIRRCGSRIISLHLQDNFGSNDDHQMPGLGGTDWADVIAALAETGYTGPLMMEMTGPTVKARRSVKELIGFELEKELVCGKAYLEYLWQEYACKVSGATKVPSIT